MYAYNNDDWGDQLTAYQGVTITYDEIGNPELYYNGTNWEFSWSQGRRLATAYNGPTAIHFQYNDEGIRTQKNVQGRIHTYRLDGSRIVVEEIETQTFMYLYDAEGSPIGMQYAPDSEDFETYWFEKNLQGDIVAVYDTTGKKLISYKYDAWGNFTTYYHNDCTASDIAAKNPFRYRGYYYDTDLEMYYLQSRYYDPVIGRFLNADVYVSTGQGILGNNMYAYCHNNPVKYVDLTGEFVISSILLVSIAGGALAGVTVSTISYMKTSERNGEAINGKNLPMQSYWELLLEALAVRLELSVDYRLQDYPYWLALSPLAILRSIPTDLQNKKSMQVYMHLPPPQLLHIWEPKYLWMKCH